MACMAPLLCSTRCSMCPETAEWPHCFGRRVACLSSCIYFARCSRRQVVRASLPAYMSFVTKYCNAAIITASCPCSFDLPGRKGTRSRRLFCHLAPLLATNSLHSSTKKLAPHVLEHSTYRQERPSASHILIPVHSLKQE